jgi:uncharacterized tellurite resistance protein B-like protein
MADGALDPEEEKFLYRVGERFGLKDRQITMLINSDKEFILYIPETHTERMDQLYDLLKVIYADGIVHNQEVELCEEVVSAFGYAPEMVPWLLEIFRGKVHPDIARWRELCDEARERYARKESL